jgi:hypothetical protein
VIFADPFAIRAPGVVAVREYGSSPRHTARSVSTKITALLVFSAIVVLAPAVVWSAAWAIHVPR